MPILNSGIFYMGAGIYDNFKKGDMKAALECQRKLNSYINIALGFGKGLAGWKAGLTLLGFDMGYTVFPSMQITDENLKELKSKFDEIGLFEMV